MTTTGDHAFSLEELSTTLDAFAGPARPRARTARRSWGSRRLAFAVALVALLIAGCSYAAHFNPFADIAAANHPAGPSDTLPAWLRADIADWNKKFTSPRMHMLASTGRFVHKAPDGIRLYTVATSTGRLCVVAAHLPKQTLLDGVTFDGRNGGHYECGPKLSPSQPFSLGGYQNGSYQNGKQLLGPYVSYGIAVNGVTAITFGAGRSSVTVRVTDNAWTHRGRIDERTVFVHWANGRTQRLCWAVLRDTYSRNPAACAVP